MGKEKNEPHTHILLRSLALSQAGVYGNKQIIKSAQQLFVKQQHGEMIAADIRGVVYNLVAKSGKEEEYNMLEKLYLKESMQEEKEQLSKAMCFFTDEKLLTKALEFSFSKHVRTQDSFIMVSYVWGNPRGKELAWKFVRSIGMR